MKPVQLQSKDIPHTREDILEDQDGLCAICKKEPKRPCLDHEHKKRLKGSGLVRGVLCSSCNVFLAKAENNCVRYAIGLKDLPRILRNVADYIEADHYPYMHPSEAPKPKKLMKSSYKKLLKMYDGNKKFPPFPKSGKITKKLSQLYEEYNIEPKFYK